jgi:hypothetical protein
MAGFGSDKEDIFTNIAIELNKVFTVSRTLATIYWKRSNQEFALSQNNIQFQEDKTQFEQILWELDPEKDSFVPVIKSAQMRLEAVWLPAPGKPLTHTDGSLNLGHNQGQVGGTGRVAFEPEGMRARIG